eukprot:344545-Chlamydomonas_euryale.AAC.2
MRDGRAHLDAKRHAGWSCRFFPTPGTSAMTPMFLSSSDLAAPTPLSCAHGRVWARARRDGSGHLFLGVRASERFVCV